MTGVIRKGKCCVDIKTHEVNTPCNNGGTGWSDASISQRMPGIVGKHQKLTEATKDLPLQVSEGAWAGITLTLDI